MPDHIIQYSGKNVLIEIVDNNDLLNKSLKVVAKINCLVDEIAIYDSELFLKFVHKAALNTTATSKEDLYDINLEKNISIEKYLEKVAIYYNIIIKDQPRFTLSK